MFQKQLWVKGDEQKEWFLGKKKNGVFFFSLLNIHTSCGFFANEEPDISSSSACVHARTDKVELRRSSNTDGGTLRGRVGRLRVNRVDVNVLRHITDEVRGEGE